MFNSAQVNRWLQDNVKSPIFHHYLLLSTKSDLLAYPRPSDIKQYRNEAALVVKAWQDADCALMAQHGRTQPSHRTGALRLAPNELHALTIETAAGNVLVRAVQPCLLLVLVGCTTSASVSGAAALGADADAHAHADADVAAGTASRERITPEAHGAPRYPARTPDTAPAVIDFSSVPVLLDDGHNDTNEQSDVSPRTMTRATSTRASSLHRSKTHSLSNSFREDSLSPQTHEAATAAAGAGVGVGGSGAEVTAEQWQEMVVQQHADILYLQREKLDHMADWLAERLAEKDFRISED